MKVKDEQRKKPSGKRNRALKLLQWTGFFLALALFLVLMVNALLCVFVDHYYPTFGDRRLFAVVTDSMEPEIPAGDMIVGRVPKHADEIAEGTVITYELRHGNEIVLITHRVISVNVNADGSVTYTTRGDNAPAADAYRPTFQDIVGVYTGDRCGFFGYFFGFLQSAEGAITLIIIALIIALTWIIIHFVNLVTVWRKVAVAALQKSGTLLSDTQIEELGTIADVIGIVSKEPLDKTDVRRKDKKLRWFLKTGSLPRRPYHDDLNESAASEAAEVVMPKLMRAPLSASEQGEEEKTSPSAVLSERRETMGYSMSVQARLIQLKPQAKEWYSRIKNELLSYGRVRVRMSNRFETFTLGRKTVARIFVRGKTLCLQLALDPAAYGSGKFAVEAVKSDTTPCQYRIKSALRAKYACALVADAMRQAGGVKSETYEEQDFYLPYEGVLSLMERGLVRRKLASEERYYKIVELTLEEAAAEAGAAKAEAPSGS